MVSCQSSIFLEVSLTLGAEGFLPTWTCNMLTEACSLNLALVFFVIQFCDVCFKAEFADFSVSNTIFTVE